MNDITTSERTSTSTKTSTKTQTEPPARQGNAWQRYPFDLVPGDPEFTFPAAEGVHPEYQSDTWFIAGELTGAMTGRRLAFLTILNKNRPGGQIVADFYTLAVFDLDTGGYGTYTDYDMPPSNMTPGAVPKLTASTGQLDMTYDCSAGTAVWKARRDSAGVLVPYTYELDLVGVDSSGAGMALRLDVSPTSPPVPLGASTYNGRFACYGQPETFSYFQTGLVMTGNLRWGDVDEAVSGTAGHLDRQWFPLTAGGGGTGGDQRAISHEWRTIHLDNGVDIVGWRQFDRRVGNAILPFTGATVTFPAPDRPPACVEDIEVQTTSYVRWPESVRQLVRPPVAARYLPDRHNLTSRTLDLELAGEPLVPAPAHALPIEYMEGPFLFRGTMGGVPVRGFGIFERSLSLYRDWELVDVLADSAQGPAPAADPADPLIALVATLRPLVCAGRRREALDCLPTPDDAPEHLRQLLDDLRLALLRDE